VGETPVDVGIVENTHGGEKLSELVWVVDEFDKGTKTEGGSVAEVLVGVAESREEFFLESDR